MSSDFDTEFVTTLLVGDFVTLVDTLVDFQSDSGMEGGVTRRSSPDSYVEHLAKTKP